MSRTTSGSISLTLTLEGEVHLKGECEQLLSGELVREPGVPLGRAGAGVPCPSGAVGVMEQLKPGQRDGVLGTEVTDKVNPHYVLRVGAILSGWLQGSSDTVSRRL